MKTLPQLMLAFGKSTESHGLRVAAGLERAVDTWMERSRQLSDAAEKLEKRTSKPALVA